MLTVTDDPKRWRENGQANSDRAKALSGLGGTSWHRKRGLRVQKLSADRRQLGRPTHKLAGTPRGMIGLG